MNTAISRKILLAIFLLLISHALFAQSTAAPAKKGFDKERLFTGGELGLSFGDYTYINVSPLLGYRFSDLLAAGININAQYNSFKYYFVSSLDHKEHYGVYGAGVFGRIYPLQWLFLHVQPEYNFQRGKYIYPDHTESFQGSAPSLLVGAGIAQQSGRNMSVTLMVLYDVLQEKLSPYGNRAIFKAGVNFGF